MGSGLSLERVITGMALHTQGLPMSFPTSWRMLRKPLETQTERAQLHDLKMTPGAMAEDYMAQFEMLAGRTGFNDEAPEDTYIFYFLFYFFKSFY